MSVVTKATNIESETSPVRLNGIPDHCPICHTSSYPQLIAASVKIGGEGEPLHVAFRCTKRLCQSLFVGYYVGGHVRDGAATYDLRRTAPRTPRGDSFSDEIKGVSPTFVDVHTQALAAEAFNLPQLTGIGLRKALEFLVKDFAVAKNPDKAEAIKKTPLAACIKTYVEDPNVKAVALRAAWLGNDETHYTRKWEDKDITDLKTLIRLTVNWVENVILTEKYNKSMTEGS